MIFQITTLGSDGVFMMMFKNQDVTGDEYMTKVFNLSISNLIITYVWKIRGVVIIPKSGRIVQTHLCTITGSKKT